MTMPRVYVETTIPSFYHDDRTDPAIIARRDWTRQWWSCASDRYELVTSAAVIDELAQGPADRVPQWLSFLDAIPLIPIDPAIADIAAVYIARRLMPANLAGDALHLALASFHKCDFLVTWNCRHLANANKFAHLRRVNTQLGLFIPTLVTPLELLGGQGDGS